MTISANRSDKYSSFQFSKNTDKTPGIVNLNQMQARRLINCGCGIPKRRESGATRIKQTILVDFYS
ncbi:hypothetical protein F7734_01410 [Scytonema sp. UIC 10036]|uniref:hypothetical protein n=1 Tax=Scytonema sp. UIC 10036 TaxID=2304196 RepID=UPI0012DA167F|nr:hypothetical protein [Scytonema sp. UIC 10036]MUG91224.1 hypothetical protein [Scytonema sp. UIC 10036]